MPIIERVLLYVVALSLGFMLLWPDSETADSLSQSAVDERSSMPISGAAAIDRRPMASGTAATTSSDGMDLADRSPAPAAEIRDRLTLVDDQGRPRIELQVGIDGHPEIYLRNEKGEPVISLTVGPSDTADVVLRTRHGSTGIHHRADGQLAMQLTSPLGPQAGLAIAGTGEISITADGGVSKSKVSLQTEMDGSAEVTVQDFDGTRRTAMWMLPSGDSGVTLQGGAEQSGPAMRLFADGLAEVTINGPGSQSGPSMVRFPDGVSIISARRPNGEPGASMIVSPDGTCVVAAASPDGTQRAELRVNAEGNADVSVTKPEPPPQASPKAQPQPQPAGPARNAVLDFRPDDQD